MRPEKIILLAGPTASGKTALALELAERLGAHIINSDSMQLYRDLPTLTARPTVEDMARAPHHLFGVVEAEDSWSSGSWMRAVQPHIDSALNDGPPVIVVGGTGLYFRTLTPGLAEIPEVSDDTRHQVRQTYALKGEDWAREILRRDDPRAEAKIAANDQQRLCRALEVLIDTGKSLSHWQDNTKPLLPEGSFTPLVLDPPRDWLYGRCDRRLEFMLEQGALEEVKTVLDQGLADEAPLWRILGAPELRAVARGEMDMAPALDQAKTLTRQYAKRQMTWFRNQTPNWTRVDSSQSPSFPLRLLGL